MAAAFGDEPFQVPSAPLLAGPARDAEGQERNGRQLSNLGSHLASPGKAVNAARLLPWPEGLDSGTNRASRSTGCCALWPRDCLRPRRCLRRAP